MIETLPPNFTGRPGAVFYVNGTPTRRIVEVCEGLGLVKFASSAWRNYALGTGPRPHGPADYLPDEVEEIKGETTVTLQSSETTAEAAQ